MDPAVDDVLVFLWELYFIFSNCVSLSGLITYMLQECTFYPGHSENRILFL